MMGPVPREIVGAICWPPDRETEYLVIPTP